MFSGTADWTQKNAMELTVEGKLQIEQLAR